MEESSNLYKIRHSLAHVLAQAVREKYPDAKLGFGPATETGFFYDFDFGDIVFHEAELKDIEKRMRKIISKKQVFERSETDVDGALEKLKGQRIDDVYKEENIRNLAERGCQTFSFYTNGPFLDLCEGPHVEDTAKLPAKAFKLDRIAGAYWLGNEKNKMLTRLYGLAFETREELQSYVERRQKAEKFDHKKLGKELDIYHIDERIGKGLPLWLPNGAVIRDEIERYASEVEFDYGYQRVNTPHVTRQELFEKSGHLEVYKDGMFPPMKDGDDTYYLKPMNCPFHHCIYDCRPRSYRDLPMRLAEYGTCYRFEQSGELSGLIRVRCMTMNDAHIYLRESDFEEEFRSVMKMYQTFYDTFRLTSYSYRVSIRGKSDRSKYKGDDAMWEKGEKLLIRIMEDMGLPFVVAEGEAAFYGPKIDIQFKNLMGREETVSTVQVDFLSAENFELTYDDEDGTEKRPLIIHRAPLSTHERFVSFLIEYYGGAFPVWCAPLQVVLIPVNDGCIPYCENLVKEWRKQRLRVHIDTSNASFNKKIRTNTVRKVPIMLIVGEQEVADQTVTVRRYGEREQSTLAIAAFQEALDKEIKERTMPREPMGSII